MKTKRNAFLSLLLITALTTAGCSAGSDSADRSSTSASAETTSSDSETASASDFSYDKADLRDIEDYVKDYNKAGAAEWEDSDIEGTVNPETEASLTDDFHIAVNYDWFMTASIPDGYSSYSDVTDRELEIQDQFLTLLEDPAVSGHDEEISQNYYNLLMDWDARNREGLKPLETILQPVEAVSSIEDLTDYLTDYDTIIRASSMVSYYVDSNPNNSDQYAVYIDPLTLILGDSSYYENMTTADMHQQPIYEMVAGNILKRLGYSEDQVSDTLEGCFSFEKAMAKYMMSTEELYGSDAVQKTNNLRTIDELDQESGDFPLMQILGAAGMAGSDTYILSEPDWLVALAQYYKEDNLENLRDYLIVMNIIDNLDYLDREVSEDYAQFQNMVSGSSGSVRDEETAVETLNNVLPGPMGNLYVENYVTEETRDDVTELTQEIVDCYREMLEKEDFLSEKTRQEAVKKLDNLQINIAGPEEADDYSDLAIAGPEDGGTLYDANAAISEYNLKSEQDMINQKEDRTVWEGDPQEVNAYYSPLENSINIMAGILGGNYYSYDMSREEKLASVGTIIAHEITHAFDSSGSQYDENGDLNNWWTEADQEAFGERAKKLIAYYNSIEAFEAYGETYDCSGTLVEGEAVADLGAMKCILSLAAKEGSASGNNRLEVTANAGSSSQANQKEVSFDYDTFFRTYSQGYRTITTVDEEIYCITEDTHPLDYLRVNGVLQQFDEFYDTYGIEEGDGMYLDPDLRLEVW